MADRNFLDGISSRLDTVEEKIGDLGDTAIETTQNETRKENKKR